MNGHAENCVCVERYCEWAKKDVSSLHQVATPCIEDQRIPPEDHDATGELHAVCAQIVVKCQYLCKNWTIRFTMVSEYCCKVSTKMKQGLPQKTPMVDH